VAEALRSKGRHCVTTAFEHKSVLGPAALLEKQGFEVTYLRPQKSGQVNLEEFERALRSDTLLCSMIWANNEVGTLLPIEKMGEIARSKGVLFHTDATQATQYLDIDVARAHVDFLTLSAHKMYGPKGVGALYVRSEPERVPFAPLLMGGGQENGLRGGTLNVPGIVGLGKAAELARLERKANVDHVLKLRNRLWKGISGRIPGIQLHGDLEQRLPNNLNFHIEGVSSAQFLNEVTAHLAVSTGSACVGAATSGSHVLIAMGYEPQETASTIRIGLGKGNTERDIDEAVEVLLRASGIQ
jgi:cysteine desulfurase